MLEKSGEPTKQTLSLSLTTMFASCSQGVVALREANNLLRGITARGQESARELKFSVQPFSATFST